MEYEKCVFCGSNVMSVRYVTLYKKQICNTCEDLIKQDKTKPGKS